MKVYGKQNMEKKQCHNVSQYRIDLVVFLPSCCKYWLDSLGLPSVYKAICWANGLNRYLNFLFTDQIQAIKDYKYHQLLCEAADMDSINDNAFFTLQS